jgi:hypothetical protein
VTTFTMNWKQSSVKRVMRNLDVSPDATFQGMSDASDFGIDMIFEQSQRLVPKETTALMQSGRVIKRNYKYKVTRTIRYGGARGSNGRIPGEYVVYVHEDLTKYHKAPTKAKFVEIPWRNYQRKYGGQLSKSIQARLRAAIV